MTARKPAVPDGMGAGGKAVWLKIVGTYDLRADELVTLEDACRITDMIAALDKAWADDDRPMTTAGSMGQRVIHPLIGEIRTQRMARNALWRQLKLPDAGEDVGSGEANQHRAAAQSKWASAHGKGA